MMGVWREGGWWMWWSGAGTLYNATEICNGRADESRNVSPHDSWIHLWPAMLHAWRSHAKAHEAHSPKKAPTTIPTGDRTSQVAVDTAAAAPPPPRGPPPVLGVENPALRELLQTEAAYGHDLEMVCDVWLRPLRELGLLPRADERALFSNVRISPRTKHRAPRLRAQPLRMLGVLYRATD